MTTRMIAGIKAALVELGLEPGCSADAVRRAYLRTIKKRNPEDDPGGFQRAREAYDLLRALPAAALSTPSTNGEDADAEDAHAEDAFVPPAPSVVPEVTPTAETGTWSEPYVTAKDPADSLTHTLREQVKRKQWNLVKQTLDTEFAAAALELRALRISPRAAVRAALEMHAAGAHASARHVTKLVQAHVRLRGGDMQVFGARHVPWFVALELDEFGKGVRSSIRSALAAAMLSSGPPVATDRLQAAMRDLDWTSVKLLRESELVAAIFGFAHLDLTAAGKGGSPGPFTRFFKWVDRAPFSIVFSMVAVFMGTLALLAWASSRVSKPDHTPVQRELLNAEQHLKRYDCKSASVSLVRAREARGRDIASMSPDDSQWFTRVQNAFAEQCQP